MNYYKSVSSIQELEPVVCKAAKSKPVPERNVDLFLTARRGRLESRLDKLAFDLQHYIGSLPTREKHLKAQSAIAEIDSLIDDAWKESAGDYVDIATANYLENYYRTLIRIQRANNDENAVSFHAIPEGTMAEITENYEKQERELKAKIKAIAQQNVDTGVSQRNAAEKAVAQMRSEIEDDLHRAEISGAMDGIKAGGFPDYVFLCSEDDASCESCAGLNNQHFPLSDAQEGVNYPLMHPNCRCRIGAHGRDNDSKDTSITEKVIEATKNKWLAKIADLYYFQMIEIGIPPFYNTSLVSQLYMQLFKKSQEKYLGLYQKLIVDGKKYNYNAGLNDAVAVTRQKQYIGKPSETNKEMLRLMEQRDQMTGDAPQRKYMIEAIAQLAAISSKEDISRVDPLKPYDYYVLYDVSNRLDQYMLASEKAYAYMHRKSWPENLKEFKELVQANGIMDLKVQPEWQHSAFIYHGEIVDKDAVGNINYGCFGRYCNIPLKVLLFGGGLVQHGGSWYSYLDDPRDSYRVVQGYFLYSSIHNQKGGATDEDERGQKAQIQGTVRPALSDYAQPFDSFPFLI